MVLLIFIIVLLKWEMCVCGGGVNQSKIIGQAL